MTRSWLYLGVCVGCVSFGGGCDDGTGSAASDATLEREVGGAVEAGAVDDGVSDVGADEGDEADAAPSDPCGVDAPTDCGAFTVLDLNAGALDGRVFRVEGRLGTRDDFAGRCAHDSTSGSEALIRFTAPTTGAWAFDTEGSAVDTVLSARCACLRPDGELACNDDAGGADSDGRSVRHSRLTLDMVAGEAVYLIVEAYDGLDAAPFVLTATAGPPGRAPVLIDARYTTHPNAAGFGVSVAGLSEDPVVSAVVRVRDPDRREPFLIGEWSVTLALDAPDGERIGGRPGDVRAFGGVGLAVFAGGDLQPEFWRTADVDVRVRTAFGVESAPIVPDRPEQTPTAARGERCDPSGLLWTCADGTVCEAPPGETLGACAEVGGCPADWPAVDLVVGPAGRAEAAGDNSMSAPRRRGACVSMAVATDVYRFVAPATGVYRAWTRSEDREADMVLFVRHRCDRPDADAPPIELGCNDDEGSDAGTSAVEFAATAGQAVHVFVDSFPGGCSDGPWRGAYTLVVDPVGAPRLDPERVRGAVDPERRRAGFVLAGTDADPRALVAELFLPDRVWTGPVTAPLELMERNGPDFEGATSLVVPAGAVLGDGIEGPVARARIRVADDSGRQSEPIELDLDRPTGRAEGEPCVPGLDTCEGAQRCVLTGGTSTCRATTPPRLTGGIAYAAESGRVWTLTLEGVDADNDPDRVSVGLVDRLGNRLLEVELPFDTLAVDPDGRFEASLRARWPDEALFRFVAALEVVAIDRADRRSEPRLYPLEAPDVIAVDDACDPLDAAHVCSADARCVDDGPLAETKGLCTRCARLGCPGEWAVMDLELGGEGHEGDSRGSPARGGGSCGGGGPSDVYRLVAPVGGRFTCTLTGRAADVDPLLYVRRLCTRDDPEFELACNDDAPPDFRSSAVDFELAAEETVYLFVDSYAGSAPGLYQLACERE